MTNEQLQELCGIWQKRLRLQDWRITARFRIPMKQRSGEASVYQQDKTAYIDILPQELMLEENTALQWIDCSSSETTLLHELLETMFSAIRGEHDPDFTDNRWEQNINFIAEALVNAY